jgi:hypothetical protein
MRTPGWRGTEAAPLICIKGCQHGWIESPGMGRGLQWDWMQIVGYASLILAGLTLAMVLAF